MHTQAKDTLINVLKLLYIEWPDSVALFVLFYPPRAQILLKIPGPRQAVIPVTFQLHPSLALFSAWSELSVRHRVGWPYPPWQGGAVAGSAVPTVWLHLTALIWRRVSWHSPWRTTCLPLVSPHRGMSLQANSQVTRLHAAETHLPCQHQLISVTA